MNEVEADHRLIKALVDSEENGVASRVAKKIGAAASTINRHYNGTAVTRLSRDTTAKLRAAYPNFAGWPAEQTVRSEVAGFSERLFEEGASEAPVPRLPLLGSAIGVKSFDPERDIELTEVNMSEVIGYLERPGALVNDGKAYALTVIGDSMWPRFRPGRRIGVSPRAPVSIGDDVIVQLRSAQAEAEQSDRITTVLIKELVRRTASYIELRQFNPDETFRVDAARVAQIHKVIGEVY